MADITSRVQKKAAELLEPGETVLAALLVEPKGSYGLPSVALAALPRTTARVLASRAAEGAAAQGGLAAAFPPTSSAIAVTDRRIVVIPSNGIGFKTIAVSYDRADLRVADNAGRGFGRRLVLAFIDGSTVTVDAQRGQPFETFAASVGGASPTADA